VLCRREDQVGFIWAVSTGGGAISQLTNHTTYILLGVSHRDRIESESLEYD
jgi:hypothetical protein